MTLKQKAISGVKWTSFSMVVVTVLQLLQISILTRFLNHSAFGIFAIVMVTVTFSHSFLDMGVSNAIIHKQKVTHNQLSTLYWINVISGILMFCIIVVISPIIADFFKEQKLMKLLILVGITFCIQPFGQQFMVLFQKEMKFNIISSIDIINKLCSLLVSAGFAYKGFGVYALVYGTIAGVSVQTLMFIYFGLKQYRPSFIFNLKEVKEFLSFGFYQMGEKIVNYFNYQIDVILIGRLLGADSLGVYSVAKQLVSRPAQLINPVVTKVTFPTMTKIQNETTQLKNLYLNMINFIGSINYFIYALIIFLAPEIVLVLFGEKWLNAVPIVRILAITAALKSTAAPVGSLLLAKGKAKLGFYWNAAMIFYIPIGLYIFSRWGLVGISWGLLLLFMGIMVPNWYFLVKSSCGANFMEYHYQIVKPMLLIILPFLVCYTVNPILEGTVKRIIIISGIATAFTLLLTYFFNKNILNLVLQIIFPKKNAKPF